MFALISPNEVVSVFEKQGGLWVLADKPGRVCETADTPFEVAEPLFWVPCEPGINVQFCYYNSETREIVVTPETQPPFEGIPTATV